ncbi:uncharacterized protein SPPG_08391 [Spizellomyces punctatus DAOM BR117]|uniref:ATP-dependent RNA helicase n=1 Tax=Spizellomyces punctatus (strain DAOM BR117) TaxID=645134 RepID=A0A0L0H4V5_SPIPD|nr:uncharacterized protein SPPG_08391 [Spizellomyces punctatus DAOM BR117]KNC96237.1 hypothetical protein SPPG_08391 [Spizellomyces punctatus DAOM BR117]|eukprot:XP_016604277.1 hypothetical protein SPPG_08391 [Spizellomyces punctatus DAOM BR117]
MGVRGLQKLLSRKREASKQKKRKKHREQNGSTVCNYDLREGDSASAFNESAGCLLDGDVWTVDSDSDEEGRGGREGTDGPASVAVPSGEPELIPNNSRLYVDALGFIYHLFAKQEGKTRGRKEDSLPRMNREGHASGSAHSFRREYGGAYRAFDSFVRREVRYLQSLGVFESILFYFDGEMLQAKHATHEERVLQKEQRWSNLYRYFCGRTSTPPAQEVFPMPPLIFEQFLRTLEAITRENELEVDLADEFDRLTISQTAAGGTVEESVSPSSFACPTAKISIVQCKVEADIEIARDVELWNEQSSASSCGGASPPGRAYCYGEDSDYFLMRGCPYIRFGRISERQPFNADGSNAVLVSHQPHHVVALEVWRREEVAAMLSLTESQLVELGILIGNDYTMEYSRSDLKARKMHKNNTEEYAEVAVQVPDEHSNDAIEELLSIVREGGEGFKLTSDNRDLQSAIALSRAIYEHQKDDWTFIMQALKADRTSNDDDKDVKPPSGLADASSTRAEEEDDDDEEEENSESDEAQSSSMLGLTSEQRRCLESWARDETWKRIAMSRGVARALLHQLTQPLTSADSKTKRAIFTVFTSTHLAALDRMLETLQSPTVLDPGEKLPNDERDDSDGAFLLRNLNVAHPLDTFLRPTWRDFQAAHTYQLILRHFFRPSTKRNRTRELLHPSVPFEDVVGHPQHYYEGEIFHKLMVQLHVGGDDEPFAEEEPLPESHSATNSSPSTPRTTSAESLPIDAYREEILRKVRSDRVTIIHGETGCGKSSRLPVMLLEDANERGERCKIYISQPRRIAVTGLTRRLRPELGKRVGMLMGHGIRDIFHETKIIFSTTGYLVRLIAGNIGALQSATHLIVDEVHERSIDSDVICLLCKRILRDLPHIKIILMSATIHTELYRAYFLGIWPGNRSTSCRRMDAANDEVDSDSDNDDNFSSPDSKDLDEEVGLGSGPYGDMKCLSVGAKRFELDILYASDIAQRIFKENRVMKRLSNTIEAMTAKASVTTIPSEGIARHQLRVAEELIRRHIAVGTGVLVFLPGIYAITELWSLLEADSKLSLFIVHSEVPFEEQVDIFSSVPDDKIKVVLATNAAESSITIPDVDVLICLGTCKSMRYSETPHESVLTGRWISKASATQRAGRTGRVRPGTVYRLYSEKLHRQFHEHDTPEVLRTTLEEVIVQLLAALEHPDDFGGIVPVLSELIEPPDISNVSKSLGRLLHLNLIDETERLTPSGRFAGQMPVSLELSRLLLFGILLGIPTEAIVLAAVLSVGRTPFRTAVPMIHTDVKDYNDIIRQSMTAADEIDKGCGSEPILWLKLVSMWFTMSNENEATAWAVQKGIAPKRLKQMSLLAESLHLRVSRFLLENVPNYRDEGASRHETHRRNAEFPRGLLRELISLSKLDGKTLNRLRLILTWTFPDKLLCSKAHKLKKMAKATKPLQQPSRVEEQEWTASAFQMELENVAVSAEQLATLLPQQPRDFESFNGWKLERLYKRLYRADMFKSNLNHVVADLLAVGSDLGVQMFWVIMDVEGSSAVEDEKSEGIAAAKVKNNTTLASSRELRLLISKKFGRALKEGTEPVADDQMSHLFRAEFLSLVSRLGLQEIELKLLPTKQGYETYIAKTSTASCAQYDVYSRTVSFATDDDEKLLIALSSRLPSSFYLQIPAAGKARLVCTDIHSITEEMLRRIFFFQGIEKRSEQSSHTQTLEDALQIRDDSFGMASSLAKDTTIESSVLLQSSVLTVAYRAPKTVGAGEAVTCPLIHDVPLSCRVLWSSMRGNLKDCELRLPDLKEDRGGLKSSPAPHSQRVEGSKKSNKANKGKSSAKQEGKLGQDQDGKAAIPASLTPVIATKVLPSTPAWQRLGKITTSDAPPAPSDCSISRNSFCGVSAHLGRGALFAVASSFVLFDNGRVRVNEGITLLPPGHRWLSLALLCLGVKQLHPTLLRPTRKGLKREKEGALDGVFDSPLDSTDTSLCDQVRGLLSFAFLPSTLGPHLFEWNLPLVDTIERIFQEWERCDDRPTPVINRQEVDTPRCGLSPSSGKPAVPSATDDESTPSVPPSNAAGGGFKLCPLCQQSFPTISLLVKHMRVKSTHGLKKSEIALALWGSLTRCPRCPSSRTKVYLRPHRLRSHLTSPAHELTVGEAEVIVAEVLPPIPTAVPSVTDDASRPSVPPSNAAGGGFKLCPLCQQSFPTISLLVKHMRVRSTHGLKKSEIALALWGSLTRCPRCPSSRTKVYLRPHRLRSHLTSPAHELTVGEAEVIVAEVLPPIPTAVPSVTDDASRPSVPPSNAAGGGFKLCPLCQQSFPTISLLVKHMRVKSTHGLKKSEIALALWGSSTHCPQCPSSKQKRVYLKPRQLLDHLTSTVHELTAEEAEVTVTEVFNLNRTEAVHSP